MHSADSSFGFGSAAKNEAQDRRVVSSLPVSSDTNRCGQQRATAPASAFSWAASSASRRRGYGPSNGYRLVRPC